jgi:hypothetical protein
LFCTSCGSRVSPDWRYCSVCAAPTVTLQEEPSRLGGGVRGGADDGDAGSSNVRSERRVWWVTTALLMGLAATVTVAALFPDYYEGGDALVDESHNLWFNLPAIAAWAIAAVLLSVPRTRLAGAGIAAGATIVWMSAYVSNIGDLVTDQEDAGLGAVLGLTGIGLAVGASVVAITLLLTARSRPGATSGGTWWALVAAVVGLSYSVGTAMNEIETTVTITADDLVFTSTGTPDVSWQCCSISDLQGWYLAGDVLLMCTAVLILLLAAAWRPGWVSFASLIGAGAAMLAFPLAGIIAASETLTPQDVGYSPAEVREAGLTVEQIGLPGLWISALAAASVFILAAIRALHAISSD